MPEQTPCEGITESLAHGPSLLHEQLLSVGDSLACLHNAIASVHAPSQLLAHWWQDWNYVMYTHGAVCLPVMLQ